MRVLPVNRGLERPIAARLPSVPDDAVLETEKRESARADQIGLVQFSSGSTVDPKAVALSHGQLMAQCAATVKKVSLELGGNAPFVVFDDADLDAAVEGALASKYRNAGQTCVCANRLYVQDGVYDAFAKKLADKVSQM